MNIRANSLLSSALLFVAALLLLSACVKPVQPEEIIEPDTVKSFIRATLRTPTLNAAWEAKSPDTLSKGNFEIKQPNGMIVSRDGITIRNLISCFNGIGKTTSSIALYVNAQSNLETKAYVRRNGIHDSLRYWREYRLEFTFKSPSIIRVPLTLPSDSLFSFEWTEMQWQEQEVGSSQPNGVTTWSITALFSNLLSVQYLQGYTNQSLYNSIIQQGEVTITRYDAQKKRLSGHFRLRVMSKSSNTIIDIEDGIFENVRLKVQQD